MSRSDSSPSTESFGPGHGAEWLNWLERAFIPQTTIFYSQILPIIHSCCVALGAKPAKICDIGAGSAAGSNLIANTMTNLLGWPTSVTAFDREDRFASYAAKAFPDVKYSVSDFFESTESFDVAVLSHIVEHLEDPESFVKKVSERVPITVVFVPFEERDLIECHVASFDRVRIGNMPHMLWGQVFKSIAWCAGGDERVAAFICMNEHARSRCDIPRLLAVLDSYHSSFRIIPR